MTAVRAFKMSVTIQQYTWDNIPEDLRVEGKTIYVVYDLFPIHSHSLCTVTMPTHATQPELLTRLLHK
jgi:hypothetical protein